MANGNSRVSACLRLMLAAGCAALGVAGPMATPVAADEVVVQREIARAKPSVLSLRSGEVVLAQRENALLGAARPGRWWVIELDGPMTPARRLSLTESGLRIAGYLPTNAFIAEADLLDTPSLRRWALCVSRANMTPRGGSIPNSAHRSSLRKMA